jgi:hypothetical protein
VRPNWASPDFRLAGELAVDGDRDGDSAGAGGGGAEARLKRPAERPILLGAAEGGAERHRIGPRKSVEDDDSGDSDLGVAHGRRGLARAGGEIDRLAARQAEGALRLEGALDY